MSYIKSKEVAEENLLIFKIYFGRRLSVNIWLIYSVESLACFAICSVGQYKQRRRSCCIILFQYLIWRADMIGVITVQKCFLARFLRYLVLSLMWRKIEKKMKKKNSSRTSEINFRTFSFHWILRFLPLFS